MHGRTCYAAFVRSGVSTHTAGLVIIAVALAAGCANRKRSDPCANGACDGIPECELGLCDDDVVLSGRTVSGHSLDEGTTNERLSAECPFPQSEIPPMEALLDDSKIPEYRRDRSRRGNHAEGQTFLQDHALHEHLLTVQGALFECLDLAACYELEAAGTGALDFQFELEPNGRVSAVSVLPSPELDRPIVRACARRSVYESKFPSWAGSRMVVDYSVEISEG